MTATKKKPTKSQLFVKNFTKNLKRVDAGIKYLDNKLGRNEWTAKIDLRMFNISHRRQCVCGQVFGDFWNEVFGASEEGTKGKISLEQAEKLGFYSKTNEYDILHAAWVLRFREMNFR